MHAHWIHEYLQIMHDPAHLLAEFSMEVLTGVILTPIIKRAVRKHDRKEHDG